MSPAESSTSAPVGVVHKEALSADRGDGSVQESKLSPFRPADLDPSATGQLSVSDVTASLKRSSAKMSLQSGLNNRLRLRSGAENDEASNVEQKADNIYISKSETCPKTPDGIEGGGAAAGSPDDSTVPAAADVAALSALLHRPPRLDRIASGGHQAALRRKPSAEAASKALEPLYSPGSCDVRSLSRILRN